MAEDISYQFQSISQRYSGSEESDLELKVSHRGKYAVEITLVNRRYEQQRYGKLKALATMLGCYLAFRAVIGLALEAGMPHRGIKVVDAVFGLWLLYVIARLFKLIKKESILFCLHFGLQTQTERFLSRKQSLFTCSSLIHDVVINEIIEDLDVHYILIVRTKGRLFRGRPIIPIFNDLRPPVDCLEVIYQQLQKVMQQAAFDTR